SNSYNQDEYMTHYKTTDIKSKSKLSEEKKNYLTQQERLRYQDYKHRHVGSIFGGNLSDRLSDKLKQEKTKRYPYNRTSKDYDNNKNDDNYLVKDRELNRQQKIQRLIDNGTDQEPFSREKAVLGDRRIQTWGKYPVRRIERSRTNPLSKKNMFKYNWPSVFTRLHGIQDKIIQHFQSLRENKQYRWEQRLTLVQGEKNILDLMNKNHSIKSLIVTAPNKPKTRYEIQPPALDYIENPHRIIADNYYLMNIDMVRKILGSAAKPEKHELVAEVHFPPI
ncbi:9590_t:CDS:1, partial [Scutellospora calospora]